MRDLEKTVVLFAAVCWTMRSHVIAGPVVKRSSRMVREVYPEIEPEKEGNLAEVCIVGDVVYGIDEPVPAEQPCLRCRCQPPGVQCETTRCVKRPGCRTIHKPNQCCPDYQCECEYNGRIYGNGERLETSPGGECKVCYCRGGEIQCAEVTCYIRNDCEGRTVPGQCCPKYDHCPPKEPAVKSYLEATQSTSSAEDTGSISSSWPTYNTTPKSFLYEPPAENNIQAKETEKELLSTPPQEQQQHEQPRITIQEIIPAIKEIPMTEKPKTKEELKSERKQDDVAPKPSDAITEIKEENDVVTFDVESDSSEISEIYHHPPPVLRIGDKLLFLKKGELVPEKDTSTPASVITIIGAEGLQRGFEDSAEAQEATIYDNSTNQAAELPKNDTTTENLNVVPLQAAVSTEATLEEGKTEATAAETTTQEAVSENETEASTVQPEVSLGANQVATTTEVYVTTEVVENRTESLENDTLVNTEENLTTEANMVEISPLPVEAKVDEIKEEPVIIEENPAYPPIPEIMVPQIVEDLPEVEEDEPKETILQPFHTSTIDVAPENNSKILPDVLEIRNNHSIPANATHPEWLKNESFPNPDNLLNLRAALPTHILKERVDSDVEYATDSTTTEKPSGTTPEATPETTVAQVAVLLADAPGVGSKETVEAASESGETTTKKSSHASLMSNENASIDIVDNESPEEAEAEGDEQTEIRQVVLNDSKVNENAAPKIADDVEMFDPTTMRKPADVETIAPSPEKIVEKRENSMDSQTFEQLNEELTATSTQRSGDEESKEAEGIFKELLEEANTTPKMTTVGGALPRRASLDSNILGILREFFTSQYRSYDGRN